MSAQKAKEELLSYKGYRSVREVLMKYAGTEDKEKLTDSIVSGLHLYRPEIAADHLRKSVDNWLQNRTRPSRENIIAISFIWKLTVEKADEFLMDLSEEGFQWRNPGEAAYAFSLAKGFSYEEARELTRRTEKIFESSAGARGEEIFAYTRQVRAGLKMISSAEEFLQYMEQNAGMLGRFRNTAYRQYTSMLKILECPYGSFNQAGAAAEKRLTVQQILKRCLFRGFVPHEKNTTGEQRELLREIANRWPDKYKISRTLSRKMGVSRKSLILLFLATDGYNIMNESVFLPEEALWEISEADVFEDSLTRLNIMLMECGFRKMDARNPFDWMILYVMSVDSVLDIDSKMSMILGALYEGGAAGSH